MSFARIRNQNHSESLGTRFVLWNTPADQAPEPLLPRPDEFTICSLCWFFVNRVTRIKKKDQLGTSTWNVFHRPAFLHYVAVGCEVVSRALEKDSCKCCDDCIQRGSDPTMCSKCINALRCPKTTRFLSSNLKYEVNINKTPKEVGMSALCPACRWLVSKPVMPE